MQRLWTEHQVHIRRALDDGYPFLTGHAATHADQQLRVALLEVAHAPEVGEHLLLRLLAHRAGVEQNEVGLFGLSVDSRPSAARSTSAILSESYSFIWQPKVRI